MFAAELSDILRNQLVSIRHGKRHALRLWNGLSTDEGSTQPPKSGPSQAQKQEMILAYFRRSRTCHTLKELEKALPPVASINSMTVKDVIKELTDENKVRVEKIGSGNWYWCWAGEEARQKKNVIAQLESVRPYPHLPIIGFPISAILSRQIRAEKTKIETSIAESQERLDRVSEEQSAVQADPERQQLQQQLGPLEAEVKALTTEKEEWENAIAGGVEGMQADIEILKRETADATDNILILEAYITKLAGGDRQTLEAIRQECYGGLYVEGEGLAEIEGL